MDLAASPSIRCCGFTLSHHHSYKNRDGKVGLIDSPSLCSEAAFRNSRIHLQWQNKAVLPRCSMNMVIADDEKPSLESPPPPPAAAAIDTFQDKDSGQKDLKLFRRPLSATGTPSSPSDGSNVRVAFEGAPGAFSEAAALKAYPKCETVPCDEYEHAFEAVELWSVDRAVLPIENTVGGSIHRNYDLLLRHRLHIVGEVQMIINHCLLGLPGARKEELKRILSHPQALSQCEMALTKLGVVRINATDTAGAAQIVASTELSDLGAIASARAAAIYGLDILAESIQDDPDNITRFLILSREPIIPGTDKPYKTSIVFSLEEGPGVLFKALAAFALRGINLTKMESRPQRKRPLRVADGFDGGSAKYFDYIFYVDFEASMADHRAQLALAQLQEFASFLRVLGCYPIDNAL